MRVIFVHTPMASVCVPERELFWKSFDLKYIQAHPNYRIMNGNLWELPHWALWLAGVLVDAGFTSLDMIDFYSNYEGALRGMDLQKVHDTIRSYEADVYLFSPMTANLHFALEIASVIKACYPKSKTVFGGVIATPLHAQLIQDKAIDYIVVDRGEYALPELLRAIENSQDFDKVGNLTYRSDRGDVVSSPRKYPFPPVNEIPYPKIDLFPADAGQGLRYIRQVHGLGCPYQCSFCTIQTIGRKPSFFPIARILNEIRDYRAYYGAHHHIYWGDETFTAVKQHAVELCRALEQEGGIHYDCQTRLNCIDDPTLMKALVASGCRWIEIGIETINQESQNLYKHKVRLRDVEDTFRRMRGEGLNVCTFMLNAFPNQTLDDMKRSIEWICDMLERDLVRATYFSNVVPFPGSPFFDQAEKLGMSLHHRDFKYYNEDLPPVFDSSHASSEEANEVFLSGLRDIASSMEKNVDLPLSEQALAGSFWQGAHP